VPSSFPRRKADTASWSGGRGRAGSPGCARVRQLRPVEDGGRRLQRRRPSGHGRNGRVHPCGGGLGQARLAPTDREPARGHRGRGDPPPGWLARTTRRRTLGGGLGNSTVPEAALRNAQRRRHGHCGSSAAMAATHLRTGRQLGRRRRGRRPDGGDEHSALVSAFLEPRPVMSRPALTALWRAHRSVGRFGRRRCVQQIGAQRVRLALSGGELGVAAGPTASRPWSDRRPSRPTAACQSGACSPTGSGVGPRARRTQPPRQRLSDVHPTVTERSSELDASPATARQRILARRSRPRSVHTSAAVGEPRSAARRAMPGGGSLPRRRELRGMEVRRG
jgi:hypothetical protein